MLVISRKATESLYIGDGITVMIAEIRGGRVRLAITAPSDIRLLRTELVQQACHTPPAEPSTGVQLSVKAPATAA